MHQEVPRHHNFTIFTSLCLSTPSTGPPLRRTGSEQRLLSRWLQAAPGTCRFSDFGRSLFFHQYLWKSMGKIKILVSFISYRIMLWIYDSLSEFFFQMDSCLDVAYRIFRTNLYHYLWKGFSENDWLVRFSMDKIVGGPCVYLVGG